MITVLNGQLEIDHQRGVIYFHLASEEDIAQRGVVTVLRICHLPEIPTELRSALLDVTHMVGTSW